VLKKDGLGKTIKKLLHFLNANYLSRINPIYFIKAKMHKKKMNQQIEEMLQSSYDRIIIWRSKSGWNMPLFQRPQHMAKSLATQHTLMLYEVTTVTDAVETMQRLENGVYLINFNNRAFSKLLMNKLQTVNKPRYIQIYSTDYHMSLQEMKRYIQQGYKILYEYIDDLNPKIVGTKELPKNSKDKYTYMLQDPENVFCVVTADALWEDVQKKRGNQNLIFACNGVDYDHFQTIDTHFTYMPSFTKLLEKGNPIIGYYGALASWMDYDLIAYIADQRPNYEIALFGVKYDDAFHKSKIEEKPNVHFFGAVDYTILKQYAHHFTVCMIPFLLNEITMATSPVKLFEYMALKKPIVTTNMKECTKYASVLIGTNPQDFLTKLDKAVTMAQAPQTYPDYFALLETEAKQNTWQQKATHILTKLQKQESQPTQNRVVHPQ